MDAAKEAEEYGDRIGMGVQFTGEDIRAIAATLYIQLAQDRRAGGAS